MVPNLASTVYVFSKGENRNIIRIVVIGRITDYKTQIIATTQLVWWHFLDFILGLKASVSASALIAALPVEQFLTLRSHPVSLWNWKWSPPKKTTFLSLSVIG
jgi:hypothetical protein